MLSLASLRYHDVYASAGGPIARVVTGDTESVDGRLHQANAFLSPELSEGRPQWSVYGGADGTGSSANRSVACHMAISEALERWAFLAVARQGEQASYGFDSDPSSNGMAAFPGLFPSQAARIARMEALERLALVSWWDGRLGSAWMPAPWPGVSMLRILHDFGPGEVVILRQGGGETVAYGHAAGRSLRSAAFKASVELARNRRVLSAHRSLGLLAEPVNFLERRALHFSAKEGAAEFDALAGKPARRPANRARIVFDGRIPGPWSRWATVWRRAYEMPTDAFLDPKVNFFFW